MSLSNLLEPNNLNLYFNNLPQFHYFSADNLGSLGYETGDKTFLTSLIELPRGRYIITISANYTFSGSNKSSIRVRAADNTNPDIIINDNVFPKIFDVSGQDVANSMTISCTTQIDVLNDTTIAPQWSNDANVISPGTGISQITLIHADIVIVGLGVYDIVP